MDKEPIDLLLLDLMLPDRPGLEVPIDVRARHPEIPVVVDGYSRSRARSRRCARARSTTSRSRSGTRRSCTSSSRRSKRRLIAEQGVARSSTSPADSASSSALRVDGARLRDGPPGGSRALDDPRDRRERHGQGARREGASPPRRRGRRAVSSPSTPARCRPTSSSRTCSGTCAAVHGAVADKKGLFKAADGGTIFFDEIGTVPIDTQAKLLRVLQEREFTPVGAVEPIRSDVRVIAATNADLTRPSREGSRFREDPSTASASSR